MMKKLAIFLVLLSVNLLGLDIYDIKNLNDAGQFNRLCSPNVREFFIKNQDVSSANIYANACLKMDKINELIIPIVMLYATTDERENAALYSTVLFQKKMLYLALVDGVDISYIVTPKVNYILSEVFDKFISKDFINDGGIYKMVIDGSEIHLFVEEKDGISQMVIAIHKDGNLTSVKRYW